MSLNYPEIKIPDNSVIYCDPPYKNKKRYTGEASNFNHEDFYDWCRKQSNPVFVSELEMPSDFEPIWSAEKVITITPSARNYAVEKLFKLTPEDFLEGGLYFK